MRPARWFFTLPVICLLSVNFLFAQDAKEVKMNELLENAPATEEKKISLDLKGIDVNELFKMLSEKSGMTIITTPEVKGRVTVFMDNLSFDDALDVVATMQDLAYEKKANVVKVMTKVEYEKSFGKKFDERKETRTIKLTYAKPANVMAVINSLKSDLGKIISDDSTGTIIITDTPQSLTLIEETIKELDKPLESAVFDINYARFADLKVYLNDLITPGVGQIIVDERSAKVVVTDLPQRLSRIRKLMEEFDEQSRQVLITGEIVEVDVDDKFQSGITWETIFTQDGSQKLDLVGNFPVSPALSSYGKINLGVLADDDYNAVVNMLSTFGSTRILSKPRIVVVNKEEAKLLVGSREAYVTAAQSQAETTTVTSESVQFIDVGVKLSVVPTIGSDGYITMKIKPEVSSVTSTLTTSAGSQVPIVATSQSETVVKIKDGSTLIITGLMKNTDINTNSGFPKLSQVPVLGSLFSSKVKENHRTELVIFITPKIITGAENMGREKL
jgi:type II secretory pathway component GspD/PulD (secretin)